jgi:hypothetical protein
LANLVKLFGCDLDVLSKHHPVSPVEDREQQREKNPAKSIDINSSVSGPLGWSLHRDRFWGPTQQKRVFFRRHVKNRVDFFGGLWRLRQIRIPQDDVHQTVLHERHKHESASKDLV